MQKNILKKARNVTQRYIERYGASFGEIDELDLMIAEAIKEYHESACDCPTEASIKREICAYCGRIKE